MAERPIFEWPPRYHPPEFVIVSCPPCADCCWSGSFLELVPPRFTLATQAPPQPVSERTGTY